MIHIPLMKPILTAPFPTEVVEVTSATGRIWMDRNLGATQAATSSTDVASYGDLYQWGRLRDGHEVRTSATTTVLSTTDVPGHGDFILINATPYDWRSPQNDNLWQGVNPINDICPPGYRLPTTAEWQTEYLTWSSEDVAGAFASPLKLPAAGLRDGGDGSLAVVGVSGSYWASTISTLNGTRFYFAALITLAALHRRHGLSVRCIKD